MRDQADKLRQLVRKTIKEHPRLEPGVPLVVVSGGAAAVGTTTIAIQLVQQLAQLGKRAVLVDANLQQPDVATQLGIEAPAGISDILDGNRSAIEVLEPINESVHVLAGRWTPANPPVINQEAVARLLTELRSLHAKADFIVLDAGSGMSPWTAQLWQAAHQVLLVTSPDSTAIMDSYTTVKLSPHEQRTGKLRLVVNQCDDRDTTQHWGDRFAETCQQFLNLTVDEVMAVASKPALETSAQNPARRLSSSFEQSIRLLAAEVLSSSLVLSNAQPTKQASSSQKNIFQKMFQSLNKAQTV